MKKENKIKKRMPRGNILLTAEQNEFIKAALNNYQTLEENDPMKKCIDEAITFFNESPLHIKCFEDILTNPKRNMVKFCMDNHVAEPTIYVYRREIVWRVAMIAYAMKIFSL